MAFKFITSGITATLDTFKKYAEAAEEVGGEACEAVAREIFDLSQTYVPVRDPEVWGPKHLAGGSLKASGRVFKIGPAAWGIGYGGDQEMGMSRPAYYAVYVHEIGRYAHEPPTRAKYLEAAVDERRGRAQEIFFETFDKKIFRGNPLVGTGAGGEEYLFGGQFGFTPTPTSVDAFQSM